MLRWHLLVLQKRQLNVNTDFHYYFIHPHLLLELRDFMLILSFLLLDEEVELDKELLELVHLRKVPCNRRQALQGQLHISHLG